NGFTNRSSALMSRAFSRPIPVTAAAAPIMSSCAALGGASRDTLRRVYAQDAGRTQRDAQADGRRSRRIERLSLRPRTWKARAARLASAPAHPRIFQHHLG